jgi:threonine dehydrogenase-like Zn-dependent dehydrogenase
MGYSQVARSVKNMSIKEAQKRAVAVVGCGLVGNYAMSSALTWCLDVYAIHMVPERLARLRG